MENTLAGSVHENYDHLLHFDVRIAAETNVRIVHNLIAPPGVRFKDLRKVYSHPVALDQCLKFFARYPKLERVPFYDTAGSVKMVMEKNGPDAAAIASDVAAGHLRRNHPEAVDRRRPAKFHALLFAVSVEEAAAAHGAPRNGRLRWCSRRATFQALCSAA